MIYADHGINWIFVYEVEYEDDDILIIKDLGRYHKYDDRKWQGHIDGWLDFHGADWVRVGNNPLKLYEIKA